MDFDVKKGNLKGVIRCFSDYGVPNLRVESSKYDEAHPLNSIFDYVTDDAQYHFVSGEANPFIKISFPKQKLFLKNYSLQSHRSQYWYMQTWKLSGSINGNKWIPLHSVYKKNYLIDGSIGTFPSNETRIGFSHFKIEMTGETIYPDKTMRVMHIELFGNLVSNIKSCKKKTNNSFSLRILLFQFISN